MMDMATYQPNGIAKKHLKAPDTRFINKLKDRIHENINWLHFVNSARVRKDVGHKLVAAGKKRTTAFDFRVNDMVSYRGAAVKILELMHPFKHGYAKARIRRVAHDDIVEDTVNYADLSPVGTARPELMLERKFEFDAENLLFFEASDGKIVRYKLGCCLAR